MTLVDDTLTSGTTCMGVHEALRRAGYSGEVNVFTVGHVLSSAAEPRDFHHRTQIYWRPGVDTHAWRNTLRGAL